MNRPRRDGADFTRASRAGGAVLGWSEKDEAWLVEWCALGHPAWRIAEALGRSKTAVLQRQRKLRDRIDAARGGLAEAKAVWPVPRAAPAPQPSLARVSTRCRIAVRLVTLSRGKFWTVARDLALARAMAAGVPVATLARDWRCEPTDVADRWRSLAPDRAQAGVVEELIDLLQGADHG